VSHLHLVPTSPAPQPTSDEACLDAYQKELDYIHRTLRRFGMAPAEVEDLAQEMFLALRHSWSEYDQSRPLRPYLFGIAFRIAAAHQRKRRREVAFRVVDSGSSGPGPEDALHAKQARAVVLAALERIPLPRRAVLIMHEVDEVPMAEVASVLSIPRFTAYSRLRKARREFEAAIRRMLKEADAL
jgi:RNA polymerase sigma-70 factor (ECF subfamily)